MNIRELTSNITFDLSTTAASRDYVVVPEKWHCHILTHQLFYLLTYLLVYLQSQSAWSYGNSVCSQVGRVRACHPVTCPQIWPIHALHCYTFSSLCFHCSIRYVIWYAI